MRKVFGILFGFAVACCLPLHAESDAYEMTLLQRDGSKYSILVSEVDSILFWNKNHWENGVLNRAKYKVSDESYVYFSQGNLQYNAGDKSTHATADGGTAKGTWRFAENQYDYIGDGNANADSTYNGWIDLFGWGTSGWSGGAKAYQPWSTDKTGGNYQPGDSATANIEGGCKYADWGVYNAISNGGGAAEQWRTLSEDEWMYLFRNNDWFIGRVAGTLCAILLPEGVEVPKGLTFNKTMKDCWMRSGSHKFTEKDANGNDVAIDFTKTNDIADYQFAQLEAQGAVALPCAGHRSDKYIYVTGTAGYYWSTSATDSSSSYIVSISGEEFCFEYSSWRYYGLSVRLVQDVK